MRPVRCWHRCRKPIPNIKMHPLSAPLESRAWNGIYSVWGPGSDRRMGLVSMTILTLHDHQIERLLRIVPVHSWSSDGGVPCLIWRQISMSSISHEQSQNRFTVLCRDLHASSKALNIEKPCAYFRWLWHLVDLSSWLIKSSSSPSPSSPPSPSPGLEWAYQPPFMGDDQIIPGPSYTPRVFPWPTCERQAWHGTTSSIWWNDTKCLY